jgi:hypothetical protein
MNCREFEDLTVEALYGELDSDARSRYEAHIASCPDCAKSHAEMRSTLDVIEIPEHPDPGAAFWDGYWNRLNSRMEREAEAQRGRGWLGWLFPGVSGSGLKWAYRGALAVVLILFGAVVGRMLLPAPGSERIETATKPTAEKGTPSMEIPVTAAASAEACAQQYIADSQVLILALVNFDPSTEGEYLAEWSAQKNRSRELVTQAASIKGDLNNPKQRRLRDLVTELEAILLQIANLEATGDLESVELIQNSVEKRDVMLRINLEKLRADDTQSPEPGACDA